VTATESSDCVALYVTFLRGASVSRTCVFATMFAPGKEVFSRTTCWGVVLLGYIEGERVLLSRGDDPYESGRLGYGRFDTAADVLCVQQRKERLRR